MKRLKFLLMAVAFMVFGSQLLMARTSLADAERLATQLPSMKTAQDSLKLIYDIFDACHQNQKVEWGWQLLDLAVKTNDQVTMRDMIPKMSSLLRRDTTADERLSGYIQYVDDKEHRKAFAVFRKMIRASEEASYVSDQDRRKMMLKYARENMTPKSDIYEDMLDLYRLVVFVGIGARGNNLYLEYLDRLGELVSRIPPDCYYIRNVYYTLAANAHTQNGNHDKAIEADRQLLKIITQLEDRASSQGRQYRDYDRYYYISYRRMLSNYEGLTPEEINAYYGKCVQLAEDDAEIEADFNGEGRPTIYKLMAEKDYAAAVPLLKNALELNRKKKATSNKIYRDMLGMLATAADAIGDKETTLVALKEYNQELEKVLRAHSTEAYRELQTRYEVNNLKAERDKSELERRDMELATGQRVITVALVALLVFVVLLMIIYRKNFTLKHKVKEMRKENVKLHKTVERLLNDGNPAGTKQL